MALIIIAAFIYLFASKKAQQVVLNFIKTHISWVIIAGAIIIACACFNILAALIIAIVKTFAPIAAMALVAFAIYKIGKKVIR